MNSLITLWSHLRYGDVATVMPHTFLLVMDRMNEFVAIPLVEPDASHAVEIVASDRDPLPPVTRAF